MTRTNELTMFYNAKPALFEKAKGNMTITERGLWECLKGKQINGLRFRVQHPLDIFIADFYCHKIKLVIEVDGGYHKELDQKVYDIGREAELSNLGIRVIHFTNEEVEKDISLVLNRIEKVCAVLLDG